MWFPSLQAKPLKIPLTANPFSNVCGGALCNGPDIEGMGSGVGAAGAAAGAGVELAGAGAVLAVVELGVLWVSVEAFCANDVNAAKNTIKQQKDKNRIRKT